MIMSRKQAALRLSRDLKPISSPAFALSRGASLSIRHRSTPFQCQHSRPVSSTRPQRQEASAEQTSPPQPTRGGSKVYENVDEAVADIQSGSTILSAGFGLCGVAETIIAAIAKRGKQSVNNLKAVSNNAGAGEDGLAVLVNSGQVNQLILSFIGANKGIEKKYLGGEISIELCPQGSIAERLRAGGAGVPAFYTPTGANTFIQTGQIPRRLGPADKETGKPSVLEGGIPRETRIFDGKIYLMETAIKGDVAILRAHQVDQAGNCRFRYTTRTFGPMMAKAARVTIVEADEIVPVGSIAPDDVHLPGIFVDRIVKATVEKKIEIRKLRPKESESESDKKSDAEVRRERIARRAAKELKNGFYVNLGVGMPTLAPSFLSPDIQVTLQSENGLLGMGPYPTEDEIDADMINAGKETVTINPGGATFDSSESFAMIRGGHVDVSILGALEVSAAGDLANYMIPGKVFKGMGGAMDLVANPDNTKIVVTTDHVDKNGKSKIVEQCSLPLTGAKCVSTIITDLCVFEVDRTKGTLKLTEVAPGVDVETVKKNTAAKFAVADDLKTME